MDNEQLIYDTVKNEFWYLLQIGGLFLNYQPKWKLFSKIQFQVYLVIVVYHIILLAITVALSLQNNDIATAAQSIYFLSFGIVVCGIIMSSKINRDAVVIILNNIATKYYNYGGSTTTVLQDKLNKKTKKLKVLILTAIPLYMSFCAAAWIIIVPIADKYDGPKESYENGVYTETPFPMWFPYLIDNNFKYIISLTSQASLAFIYASTISAADLGMIFFALDLITQLKILNQSIETIEERAQSLYEQNGGTFKGNKVKSTKEKEIYFKFVNYCIKQNVEHHKVLNQSFNALVRSVNWPLTLVYLTASIMIALSLHIAVSGSSRLAPQLLSLLLVFGEICNMYILCWLGQELSDQSANIFQQFYNLKWFNWNQSCKLSLIIVRERNKQNMVLDGAGMIASNFRTFSDIMSSAYTYFQLIYALEREK